MSIRFRRGTTAQWAASTRILEDGEPGVNTDTLEFKIGDGVSLWGGLASFGTPTVPTVEVVAQSAGPVASNTLIYHYPPAGVEVGDIVVIGLARGGEASTVGSGLTLLGSQAGGTSLGTGLDVYVGEVVDPETDDFSFTTGSWGNQDEAVIWLRRAATPVLQAWEMNDTDFDPTLDIPAYAVPAQGMAVGFVAIGSNFDGATWPAGWTEFGESSGGYDDISAAWSLTGDAGTIVFGGNANAVCGVVLLEFA